MFVLNRYYWYLFFMIKKIVLVIVTFVIITITLTIPDNDNIALEYIVLQTIHRCKRKRIMIMKNNKK